MNACEIIQGLEQIGYTLTVIDGKVCGDRQDLLPPPPESVVLLDQLRLHKGEILDILLYRGFTEVPANEGDLHVITVDATNEREMLRWALAVDTGIIALVGKILYRTSEDTALIRYRCPFPVEWLPDAITHAAKQKYNHTLERIRKGERWLAEHGEGHPGYQKAYDVYLALYEDMRQCYIAIGEQLLNPYIGYQERSDA